MTTITALPPPPDPGDSLPTFNSKAFAFWAAMPNFRAEINTVAGEVNVNAATASAGASTATSKAAEAVVSANSAIANAQAAAASAGGGAWVSGTTYAVGDRRWSLVDGCLYRRRTAGAGTTDPAADPTNWALVPAASLVLAIVSGTAQTAAVGGLYALRNGSLTTLTAPPSPQPGDRFGVKVANGRSDNVIDWNGAKHEGLSDSTMKLHRAGLSLEFIYIDATYGWGIF